LSHFLQVYGQQPQQQQAPQPGAAAYAAAPSAGANPYSRGQVYGQYPMPTGHYPQTQ